METKSNANEAFKITGDWTAQSKQLKQKFSQLTDEDLKFESGKESELLSRLEGKLNKKRDEVIAILKSNQTTK